jgi:hypothetical protein
MQQQQRTGVALLLLAASMRIDLGRNSSKVPPSLMDGGRNSLHKLFIWRQNRTRRASASHLFFFL